jgi:CIC family chloride channel protein
VLILLFCLLGVACAVVGAGLVRANYAIADRFGALPLPRWIKPAVGGLFVGIIGLWAPGVLGEGYETVNEMILARGAMPGGPVLLALVLLGLCALKIVASALTLGSGGTGGAFAPSMVCGALVGGAFGLVANELVPTFAPDYRIFALVGMAGVVGSAIGAPLAAMLIIYEVCGGRYVLVLPLMLTVAISSLVSGRLRRGTVYTMSLLRDGFDVEADHRVARDPLKEIPVSSIMTVHHAAIRPADPLARVIDLVERTDQEAYVVLNDAGELAGVISTNDLRGAMNLGDLGHAAIIAQDIANPNPRVLLPGATASEALDAFNAGGIDAVVVVEAPGSRRVAGVVFRGAVLRAMCEPARRESSPDVHARP